jgi:hypothetical protein
MASVQNTVGASGHEKTMGSLDKITEDYAKASVVNGKPNFNQKRFDDAVKAIKALSPFYSEANARQMLNRASATAQEKAAKSSATTSSSQPAKGSTASVTTSSSSGGQPRAADDFTSIKARREELAREVAEARNKPPPDASISLRPVAVAAANITILAPKN